MTLPNREAIIQKAIEMFFEDSIRNGNNSTITPEIRELAESGYLSAAQSELMRSVETKYSEFLPKLERPERTLPKIETRKDGFFNVAEALDTGFFISGTSQSGKTNLAKWLTKALIDFGVTLYVFDPSQAWNDGPIGNIIEVSRNRSEYDFGTSTVFDLSALTLRDKVVFVNDSCKHVYKAHVAGYRRKEFLIFEEAQSYMPNGSFRLSVRRNPMYEGAVNIVTVGANYGVRFGLICQFPSMVDKAPVKIAMQRYFGWTLEKNDTQYIKSFIGKENLKELANLQKGSFVYQNRGVVQMIQVEKFGQKTETPHQFEYNFNALPQHSLGINTNKFELAHA